MDNKSFQKSREEGRNTWYALEQQWAEATGFFGAMFGSFVAAVRKQFLGYLLFALVFALLGGAYGWFKQDVYTSRMTVSYAQLEKKIYGDMLFKLNLLLESHQHEEVARLLMIPQDQAAGIVSIEGVNIHNMPLTEDLSVEKVPFYIEVKVQKAEVLPTLETALVQYISNSQYVEERLKLNESNYKKEIIHLRSQLAYMDSLKVILMSDCAELDGDVAENLNKLNESQNVIFGKLRDYESALQFNKNIEVMDGFIAQHDAKTSIILRYIILGMALGVVIRLLYLIFR